MRSFTVTFEKLLWRRKEWRSTDVLTVTKGSLRIRDREHQLIYVNVLVLSTQGPRARIDQQRPGAGIS